MKYKVKILKQPKYQDGGRTLGDFSNLTEDQLDNGLVYGFNEEPEEVMVPNNAVYNNRPVMTAMENIPYVMKAADKQPMVAVPISALQSIKKPENKNKSIVNALTELNLPSSFSFRKKLAAENNIKNYTGTANQNLKLLSLLSNQVAMSFDEEPIAKNVIVSSNNKSNNKSSNKSNNKKQTSINSNVKNIIPFINNSGGYQITASDVNRRPFQSEINMGSLGNLKVNGKNVGRNIDPRVYEKSMVNAGALAASAFLPSLVPTVEILPLLRGLPKPPPRQIAGPRNLPTAPPKGWTSPSGMTSPGYPFYQYGGGMEQQDGGQEQVLQIIQAYAETSGVDPKELMAKLQSMSAEEQQQIIAQMYQSLQGGGAQQQAYSQNMQEESTNEEDDMYQDDLSNEEDDMRQAAYGGQMGYGLDLGSRRLWMNQDDDEQSMVNRSIKEVPRNEANIEAEGGETALIPNSDNNDYSHFNIQGKRHTQGGVPLNVPEGTFIYSDTKKMKLGGSVLKVFGKSDKTSKKYTPADLAKQYDLNKYTAILESPKSSQLEKRTAELMIQNYNKKLAQLALVQEDKKGYPQGIPKVAEEYYAKTKAYVQSQQAKSQPQEMQEQQSGEDVDQDMEQDEQPQAMYGMGFKYGGGLKRFVDGSEYKGIPYSYTKPQVTQNDLLGIQPVFTPNEEDDNTPTPPSNLTYKNEIDYSNVVENNKPQFEGWGDSEAGKKYGAIAANYANNLNNEAAKSIAKGATIGAANAINAEDKKNEENYTLNKSKIRYGWTNPDKLNLLNSFINLAGVRRSTPFEPTMKFERPETRYLDPSRALAANAEQYNAARQAAGMFAGPQSRYSFNAGQFGKNAADIIAQTSNQNVQLGNVASNQAADITNKQIMYDAQRAKRLYDAGVIGEQQYQNSMKQARAGVLQAYGQGMKNAADIFNLSMSQSPYYAVNAGTGTMYFHTPKSQADFYNQSSNNNKNVMSPEEFSKYMKDNGFKEPTYNDYTKYLQQMQGSSSKSARV